MRQLQFVRWSGSEVTIMLRLQCCFTFYVTFLGYDEYILFLHTTVFAVLKKTLLVMEIAIKVFISNASSKRASVYACICHIPSLCCRAKKFDRFNNNIHNLIRASSTLVNTFGIILFFFF